MIRRIGRTFVFACALVNALSMSAQARSESFTDAMPAGERTDLRIDVSAGETDPETFIPVSVVKGDKPGPTVLMVAGVHGYEFSPILAAQRLAQEIDPETLSGEVIIVRIAHVPAFEGRSPYVNPNDRKNLNRSFPGKVDGTQTERIAWALSSIIIPAADFVLDVHGGDGAEWLDAFIGVYGGPLSSDYQSALNFAEAMGFPNIVRYSMNTQEQVDRLRSLNRQAVAQGVPTILVEIGQNGSRDPGHVETIVSGLKRGLRTLGMSEGASEAVNKPLRYFDGTQSVPVSHSGVWTPILAKGRAVERGDILGTIHDYEGRLVETVTAPVSGFTIYGLAGPPVRAGESIATIAQPTSRAELLSTDAEN